MIDAFLEQVRYSVVSFAVDPEGILFIKAWGMGTNCLELFSSANFYFRVLFLNL